MVVSKLKDLNIRDKIDVVKILIGQENMISEEIKRLKLKRLGYEDGFVTVKGFNELKKKYEWIDFVGISSIVEEARIVKDDNEIAKIKEAARLADVGMSAIEDIFEEGKTEIEIAAEVEYQMRKNGSSKAAFETIVASGERSIFPHGVSTQRKIKDGDIITIDIGAVVEGYNSDLTRTFIFGKVQKEPANIINLVNDAHKAVLEVIKAGEKCVEMDNIARNFFEKNKVGEFFIHGLGHGVGVDIHELPYLNSKSNAVLEENMVVTVEPGIYIPGKGGARTEDLIVVKQNGYECLSKSKIYYY
jgi:Xaa-Pro aminopeptidase